MTTTFSYGGTTITMEHNPRHERNYTEERACIVGYDSAGNAYAYDEGTPIFYSEALIFPKESLTELLSLLNFFEQVTAGAQHAFAWMDRGVSRTARYKGLSYINVTKDDYQIQISVEVQT